MFHVGHLALIGHDAMQNSNLPETGFVRLPQILAVFPVSKSHWWQGIKDGRYPPGTKISRGITTWNVEQIRKLLASKGSEK